MTIDERGARARRPCTAAYGASRVLHGVIARGARGRGRVAPRAERRRQVDHAQGHRQAGGRDGGRRARRRPRHHARADPRGEPARRRLGARGPPDLRRPHGGGEPARSGPRAPASGMPPACFASSRSSASSRAGAAGSLSGGEQQMLTVARTLMGNPRVLLLDEPSEGLAPVIVRALGDQIAALKRQGLTILLSEQNLEFAARLADRAYIIEKGADPVRGRRCAELDAERVAAADYLTVLSEIDEDADPEHRPDRLGRHRRPAPRRRLASRSRTADDRRGRPRPRRRRRHGDRRPRLHGHPRADRLALPSGVRRLHAAPAHDGLHRVRGSTAASPR